MRIRNGMWLRLALFHPWYTERSFKVVVEEELPKIDSGKNVTNGLRPAQGDP
jgi:hypothetical protein